MKFNENTNFFIHENATEYIIRKRCPFYPGGDELKYSKLSSCHLAISALPVFDSLRLSEEALIWTNAEILLIQPLETKVSEILSEIQTFSFKKMYLKMLSAKWLQFCLILNMLINAAIPYFEKDLHIICFTLLCVN